VNGDHVSGSYLTVEKYRPIHDDDTDVGPLRIGCAGVVGDGFHGYIRHVRYWSGARTQTDLRDSMHTSTPMSTTSSFVSNDSSSPSSHATMLVGAWPLSCLDSSSSSSKGNSKGNSEGNSEDIQKSGLRSIVGEVGRYTESIDFKRRRVSVRRRRQGTGSTSLVFNQSKSDSRLKFSDGDATVTCIKNHQYQTAMSSEGFTTGQHYWEIQVEKSASGNSGTYEMFVGVGEDKMSTKNCFVGQQCSSKGRRGWGYYSRGQKYSGSGYSYGTTYGKKGDVIGVLLDMDAGTLGFTVNGKDQGVAFTSIATQRRLYPCVSLYTSGQSVSVLSTSSGARGRDGFFSGLEGVVERAESKISSAASAITSGGGTGGGSGGGSGVSSISSPVSLTSSSSLNANMRRINNESAQYFYHQQYVTWKAIPVPYMDVAPSLELSVHVCSPPPLFTVDERQNNGALYGPQGVDEKLIASSILEANEATLELGGHVGKRIIVR
jgi:hypothetical protein